MRETVILPNVPPNHLSHIDSYFIDRMNIGNTPPKRTIRRSSINEEHFGRTCYLQIVRDLRIIIDKEEERNDLIIGFDMFELIEDNEQNETE